MLDAGRCERIPVAWEAGMAIGMAWHGMTNLPAKHDDNLDHQLSFIIAANFC